MVDVLRGYDDPLPDTQVDSSPFGYVHFITGDAERNVSQAFLKAFINIGRVQLFMP